MKLLSTLALCAAVVLGISLGACSSKDNAAEQQEAAAYITVDSLLNAAPGLVGDTVVVAGPVSHLCSHGGTKAFILSPDSTQLLRCQATADMGGAFSPECLGNTIVVTGVVTETRIDEDAVKAMEEKYAAQAANADHGCETERAAEGQDSTVNTFEKRMNDYRARIAAQVAEGGNPYLSFYHVEAIAYDIQ